VRSSARLVGIGVFVVSGLLLFGIGLFMIGDRQMAFAKKFVIYTGFTKITGLQPGAIVRVSGAKAGTVKEIVPPSRPSDKFRVKLEITDELHPLVRMDSIASIETEGLVGGSYLAVGTGTDQSPVAPENATIPSREPFEIGDLLQRMSATITKINDTIDLLQDDVQHAVQAIGDTVDNANALLLEVSDDVTVMASAGARISKNAADISDTIRSGRGTLGKLVNDDELYQRATSIARSAEEIAVSARQVVEQARKAVDDLQAANGPVQGVSANLKQTLDEARAAMAAFAQNMEALKHNFFFRGYFNDRGYFRLADVSPAQYREGLLAKNGQRVVARVWLNSAVLFDADPQSGAERLSEPGRTRLDSAIAPYLLRLPEGVLVVEGYSQSGTQDEQFLKSRERATMVRNYLVAKFHLDPESTGLMPLGAESTGSPGNTPWNGVVIAAYLDRRATPRRD
jgi:phospholipid/cholesterol/gamma-HCH transport system substrate-binding protein